MRDCCDSSGLMIGVNWVDGDHDYSVDWGWYIGGMWDLS